MLPFNREKLQKTKKEIDKRWTVLMLLSYLNEENFHFVCISLEKKVIFQNKIYSLNVGMDLYKLIIITI